MLYIVENKNSHVMLLLFEASYSNRQLTFLFFKSGVGVCHQVLLYLYIKKKNLPKKNPTTNSS